MDHTEIRNDVSNFIVTNFLFGDKSRLPAAGESLIEGGIVDSTGILELIEFVEGRYGFSVTEAETVPDNLGSIDNLTRYISAKAQ